MARPKKISIPPSSTSHLFGGRKPADRGSNVTSERIADDLEAFRKSGGRIEVLGTPRVLKTIEADAGTDAKPAPAQAAPKGRRGAS